MHRTHILLMLLLSGICAAGLSGCANEAPAPSAGLRPSQAWSENDALGQTAQTGSPYGLYLAGEAAIDSGASRTAARYFASASRLEPAHAGVRIRAFTTALVSGEIAGAADVAQGLTEGNGPIQHLARLTRAVEALAEDRGAEAYAILSTEPPGASRDPAIRLMRPWAAAAAGDWKVATAPAPVMGDATMQAVAEMTRAQLLERNGQLDEAEAVLKARAARGRDGLFLIGYAGFLERHQRRPEAAAVLARAVKDLPGDRALKSAKARFDAGRPAAGIASFREGAAEALIAPAVGMVARREGDSGLGYLRLALRLDPSLDEAWVLVGDAMNGAGDIESAKDAYRRVKSYSPEFVAAHSRLALLAQQAGDQDAALRLARETMEAAPADPRAMVLYADLLRDDDRYPEAVQVLSRAIQGLSEADAGWALFYERGVAEERAGDWPSAEADLQHALKLKPDEPQALNYLGYAWADRGVHLEEALAMLEKAAALEPRSGAIADSLGWARYRIHQYPDAMKDLERAVVLAPSDPEVNSHLGDAYWKVGRMVEARFQWQRVLTLDADRKTRAAAELKLTQGLNDATEGQPRP